MEGGEERREGERVREIGEREGVINYCYKNGYFLITN